METTTTEKTMSQKSSNIRREKRYFSDEAQRKVVKEIEDGLYNKREASRIYQVSEVTIYKWMHKHSFNFHKQIVTVCELESESKRSKQLSVQLSEAEKILGQMTVENVFLKELLSVISEKYDIDFKKNINMKSYKDLETIKALIKSISKDLQKDVKPKQPI
jgi:transposase